MGESEFAVLLSRSCFWFGFVLVKREDGMICKVLRHCKARGYLVTTAVRWFDALTPSRPDVVELDFEAVIE